MGRLLAVFFISVVGSKSIAASSSFVKSMTLGFDFGMSYDIAQDPAGGYGTGFGSHGGLFSVLKKENSWPIKFRFENINLKEEGTSKASFQYQNTTNFFKSYEQRYWLLSGGIEKRFQGENHIGFFEMLVGYGWGQPSQIVLEQSSTSNQFTYVTCNTLSSFVLSLGGGFRRHIGKSWDGLFSVRTLYAFGGTYGDLLSGTSFIVVPVLFSLGLEYNF